MCSQPKIIVVHFNFVDADALKLVLMSIISEKYSQKICRDGEPDVRDAGVRQGGQAAVPHLHQATDQGVLLLLTGTLN